ncbi:hypothetical protein D515_01457 [Grimontia indica]|uniref:Uncharacterized protein n=1 Tax=Grimontia indica TaxID=1056512 RepID=R1GTX0_9GAMM|nr:hypothetical protein D515_01457 [Grimontia indica]
MFFFRFSFHKLVEFCAKTVTLSASAIKTVNLTLNKDTLRDAFSINQL